MDDRAAGAIAGLTGGIALSVLMATRRRLGLHPTLAERSEAWLDEKFHARRYIGRRGVTVLEQVNHLAAGIAFGVAFAVLERRLVPRSALTAGAVYGLGMYAVNIGVVAPFIGLTRGEWNEPAGVRLQRAGLHVLYGAVAAAVTEALRPRRGRR